MFQIQMSQGLTGLAMAPCDHRCGAAYFVYPISQFIPPAISVHEQYTRCSYRVMKFRGHFLAIIVDFTTPVLDA